MDRARFARSTRRTVENDDPPAQQPGPRAASSRAARSRAVWETSARRTMLRARGGLSSGRSQSCAHQSIRRDCCHDLRNSKCADRRMRDLVRRAPSVVATSADAVVGSSSSSRAFFIGQPDERPVRFTRRSAERWSLAGRRPRRWGRSASRSNLSRRPPIHGSLPRHQWRPGTPSSSEAATMGS